MEHTDSAAPATGPEPKKAKKASDKDEKKEEEEEDDEALHTAALATVRAGKRDELWKERVKLSEAWRVTVDLKPFPHPAYLQVVASIAHNDKVRIKLMTALGQGPGSAHWIAQTNAAKALNEERHRLFMEPGGPESAAYDQAFDKENLINTELGKGPGSPWWIEEFDH